MKFHDVATLLPLMPPAELSELAADIKTYGQREPIYTFGGEIIDGRNRFLACEIAGVKPRLQEWDGKGSLVAFVLSENVKRRHLTSTQRAVIGEAAEQMFRKEAKDRQAHGKTTRGRSLTEKFPEAMKGEAREKAARAVGTNGHYITDVKAIKQVAPELVPLMRDGKATVEEAKLLKSLPPEDRKMIVEHVEKGDTLDQAIQKLDNSTPLPTPAQARKLAIATGRPVLANNNYEIPPITEEEERRIVDELAMISDFAEAVQLIAEFTMPDSDVWTQLEKYYIRDLGNHLEKAIDRLTRLEESRRAKELTS
jgi:ParB-like chromosome segregation protein Spo0J